MQGVPFVVKQKEKTLFFKFFSIYSLCRTDVMEKPKSVKKFYSLAETLAIFEGENVDLEQVLSHENMEERNPIPETLSQDDLDPYSPIIESDKDSEEDNNIFSDLEDMNSLCNEALSLVRNVNDIIPFKKLNFHMLKSDDSDSENDVQDNDDDDDLPGEISLNGSEPNIDINNDNSSQEQINSLPDEITDDFQISSTTKKKGSTERQPIKNKYNVLPPCNCKKKCITLVNEEERRKIFEEFWSLGTSNERRDWMFGHIFQAEKVSSTVKAHCQLKQREYSRSYYFT